MVGRGVVILGRSYGGAVRGHKELRLRGQIYASSFICPPTLCGVNVDPKNDEETHHDRVPYRARIYWQYISWL